MSLAQFLAAEAQRLEEMTVAGLPLPNHMPAPPPPPPQPHHGEHTAPSSTDDDEGMYTSSDSDMSEEETLFQLVRQAEIEALMYGAQGVAGPMGEAVEPTTMEERLRTIQLEQRA